MRKVMFLALLAASVAAPTAAMAQRGEGGWRNRDEARPARVERSQPRQEYRAERQENRAERQQARQENSGQRQQARQARQQPQRQQQPAAVAQQRQDRPTRSGWMGNPNDARMEAHRERYERIDRQNARRNGTEQQYRSLVEQQGSQRQARREDRQDWRNDRRDNRQDWRNDRRNDRRDWRNDRRGDRGNWNRGWRNDNRYDWQRYRNTNRFVFRIQPYYSPYRGYGYNRFSIGNILDRLFWGQNYWINDPWTYRLPPAPYGYQWVRYYNDVVLVDTYNGEIVDVIYDFFW